LTAIQTDIKKLIAYSRVVHITFLMVGVSRDFFFKCSIVLLVSMAHGGASILLFLAGGTSRDSSMTRLLFFNSSEEKMH